MASERRYNTLQFEAIFHALPAGGPTVAFAESMALNNSNFTRDKHFIIFAHYAEMFIIKGDNLCIQA